jgi:two-component SAPR family response regulator
MIIKIISAANTIIVLTLHSSYQIFDLKLVFEYSILFLLLEMQMNGLEIGKGILAVNPRKRIIFASAYVQDILLDSISQLNQIVEILNKPFNEQELIDTVEDKSIYSELRTKCKHRPFQKCKR